MLPPVDDSVDGDMSRPAQVYGARAEQFSILPGSEFAGWRMVDASRDLARARVDQVGSLLRPSWLKDVYARHGRGEATDEELRAAQDEAVRAVVARQEAIGFPIVTDGELRRLNFQDSFSVSVSGFAATPSTAQFHEQRVEGGRPGQRWDPGYVGEGPAVVHRRPVVERIALARNLPL